MKFPFEKRRHRQYPIRYDRSGRSMRQQAFEFFDAGHRPSQIYNAKLVQASQRTLYRYFEDWKRDNNRPSPSMLKRAMARHPGFTEERFGELSEQLGIPVADVLTWAKHPWGILQLLGEQLYGKPVEVVAALMADIVLLRDDSLMEIRKEHGMITVTTRREDGKITRKRLRCRSATA